MQSDQLTAFLSARYRVEAADGQAFVHIGKPAEDAERLLGVPGPYALVTAFNPWGKTREASGNEAADKALAEAIDALSLLRWRALNAAPDGRWVEPGWLVAGIQTADLDALARRFGQRGVLHWERGAPVRLRLYARPDETAQDLIGVMDTPFCDWVACAQPGTGR